MMNKYVSLFFLLGMCNYSIFPVDQNTVTGNVSDPESTFNYIWDGIAATHDNVKIYVSDYGSGHVSIIDVATNRVTGIIDETLSNIQLPNTLAISYNDQKAYVYNVDPQQLTIVDVATDSSTGIVTDLHNYLLNAGVIQIVFALNDVKAYTVNQSSGQIAIIDVAANTITGLVTTAGYPLSYPSGMILISSTKGYVTSRSNNSVRIIDTTTDELVGTVTDPDSTFLSPTSITMTSDGTKAYVLNTANDTVTIINIATDTVVGLVVDTLSTFQDVYSIVMSPDNSVAYVVNRGNNTLSIIDVATDNVTGVVDAAVSPFVGPYMAIMVTTANGIQSYVTNNDSGAYKVNIVFVLVPISSPNSIHAIVKYNRFLSQTDTINIVTWTEPLEGNVPTSYRIYRNADLTDLITTVFASDPLIYYDHNRIPGTSYSYYIVSVDEDNNQSSAISTTIVS